MAVNLADGGRRYPAIEADDLDINRLAGAAVGLQIPRDRGVPEGMPDNPLHRVVCRKFRLLDNRFQAIPNAVRRSTVKFSDRMLVDAKPLPAAPMRQEARR